MVLLEECCVSTCRGAEVQCLQQGCLPQPETILTQRTGRGIVFWLLVSASYISCTWRLRLSASLLSPVKVYFIKKSVPESGLCIHANLWMWCNWNKVCVGWGCALCDLDLDNPVHVGLLTHLPTASLALHCWVLSSSLMSGNRWMWAHCSILFSVQPLSLCHWFLSDC